MKIEMMILATLLISQAAQADTLPDEIDYVTYRAIVQRSLDESTALRGKANVIQSQISSLELQISKNQDLIQASNARINSNDGTSVQLLEENSRRYNEVARLNQDTERLRNELSELSRQYNSLTQDLNNIDRQLAPARIELQRLDTLWRSIRDQGEHAKADYDEMNHRLEHKNRELDNEKDSLQKITRDIQQSTLLISDLQSRIAPLENQIAKSFDELSRLNNEHSRLTTASQQAHTLLQTAQQQLAKSQGDLKNAEVVLAPMKEKADSAAKATAQIQGEKNAATLRLNQNEAKLQDAQKSVTQLPAQISAMQTRADSQKSRITALTTEIEGINAYQVRIENEIQDRQLIIEQNSKIQPPTLESIKLTQQAKMKIESLKAQRTKSQQDEANLTREKGDTQNALALSLKSIQDLTSKNDSIAAQIAILKDTKISIGNEISEIEGHLSSAISSQQAAARELELASQGLKTHRDAVAQSQAAVDQKLALASKADKDINDIIAKKSATQDAIAFQQKSLADIKAHIPEEMKKIEVSKNDAQRSRNRQNEILNDLNDLNRKIRDMGNYLDKLKDDAQRVSYQYSSVNDQVTRLDSSRNALVAQINQVAQRSGADQNQVEANLDATNNHLGTIQRNTAIVTSLKEMNAQLRNDIASSQSSIATLSRDLDTSRRAFVLADNSANAAEAKTARDESARQQRERLYLQYSDEAKRNGSLQGTNLALPLGQANGKKSANLAGFNIGTKIGAETALLNGRYRGLLRGKLAGDSEGYTAGVNSALDYQRGFDGGYSTGKETARLQALHDSYPVGYKRQKDVLLKNIPTANVVLNNQEDKVIMNNFGVNSIVRSPKILALSSEMRTDITSSSDETELSQEEIQNALAIRSAINPQVEQVLVSMNEYNRPEKNLSQAQYVYVRPETTPYDSSKAQCDDVYKAVAALKTDCQASFKADFETTYYSAYKDTFVQNYSGVYTESRTNNFEQRKNEAFGVGRSDSYKVVFSEAKTRGAIVAENRGAVDGKGKGFSENIANLQAEYDKLGAFKADSYFQNNGVIRSLSNGVISTTNPRGLAQGSIGKLGLKLANFGFADTYRNDVVVSFKALTENVTVLNPKTTLRGLPRQSRIDLANISDVKISNDAVPGSKVSVKATLYFKGDELSPSYEQEALLEGVVGVNPEIGSSYSFDESVVYKKWIIAPFKWKFRSHDIDVTLKGLRDNVPAGYNVEISILEGSDYVQLENSSVKTEAIARGETSNAKFTYTFIQKVKDDVRLKFKVKIKYLDEVLEEKIINVTGTN